MNFSRARLRGHREGRRLSQAALGALVGLEAGEVAAIEAGVQRGLSELLVADLARALDVPLYELHCIDADYAEDYGSAFMAHAAPVSDDDCRLVADILSRRGRHAVLEGAA